MKFSATTHHTGTLLHAVSALYKVSRDECLLQITPTRIVIAVVPGDGSGFNEMEAWVNIPVSSIFERFTVQSLRENCIAMVIPLTNLFHALKKAANATWLKLKLTKRDGRPCLSLGMGVLIANVETTLSHDVPVRLVSRDQAWRNPPRLPPPVAQVLLPPLPQFRRAIERLRLIDETVDLEVGMAGELVLLVDARTARVRTRFKVSPVRITAGASSSSTAASSSSSSSAAAAAESQPSSLASSSISAAGSRVGRACVSSKVLLTALGCAALQPTHVVCCCIEGRSLVLRAMLDDVSIDYYLPVLSDPNDGE